MEKIKLNVEGMHCSSCEMLVNDALEEIGVKSKADSKSGIVEVEFDESKTNKIDIINIIKKEGYKVKK
jgi:copper chaperone CopZ